MASQLTRRRALRLGTTVGVLGVAGCLGASGTDSRESDDPLPVDDAQQYSSPGCACCEQYASYLDGYVRGNLSETVPDDVAATKREHGIPADLRSCHTVVLDEYVVEGHVPVAAIATLLDDEPAVDGIALPGMPRGSPGMRGETDGPLTIYVVDGDRSGRVYAEL
ncbi:DUF411 domain-containing protein [Halosimplex salinum]|uniref:DUF411 domain-containing protein n=1 Tax=Halosimplex salinum TaxID=1710538 RepID=UPI000F4616FE|nr:DUF411 domain-containing protein [Halosimplex salinum]